MTVLSAPSEFVCRRMDVGGIALAWLETASVRYPISARAKHPTIVGPDGVFGLSEEWVMTTIVNDATRAAVSTNPLAPLPSALALIAIFLLVSFLIEKEFFRAQGRYWIVASRTLDTAIIPLSIVVVAVLLYRALSILNYL